MQLHGALEVRLDQQFDKAGLGLEPEPLGRAAAAQVTVNEERPVARPGEENGKAGGNGGLALTGDRRGEQDHLGVIINAREPDAGVQVPDRLGERRIWLVQDGINQVTACDLRHRPQRRQAGCCLHLVEAAVAAIENAFDEDRRASAGAERADDRQNQELTGLGKAGHAGPVSARDDGRISLLQALRIGGLLETLQERIEQRALCRGLALKHGKLGGLMAAGTDLALHGVEAGLKGVRLGPLRGGVVAQLDQDFLDFLPDLGTGVLELGLEADHLGMAGAELLREVGDLPVKVRFLGPEPHDCFRIEDLGDTLYTARAVHLLDTRQLGIDGGGLGLRNNQLGVELGRLFRQQGIVAGSRQLACLGAVLLKRAFGGLDLLAQITEALIQPFGRGLGRLKLGLVLADDILLGNGIGEPRRQRRIFSLDSDGHDRTQPHPANLQHRAQAVGDLAAQPDLRILGRQTGRGLLAPGEKTTDQTDIIDRIDIAPGASLTGAKRRIEDRVLLELQLCRHPAKQVAGGNDLDLGVDDPLFLARPLKHLLDIDDVALGATNAHKRRGLIAGGQLQQIDEGDDKQDGGNAEDDPAPTPDGRGKGEDVDAFVTAARKLRASDLILGRQRLKLHDALHRYGPLALGEERRAKNLSCAADQKKRSWTWITSPGSTSVCEFALMRSFEPARSMNMPSLLARAV